MKNEADKVGKDQTDTGKPVNISSVGQTRTKKAGIGKHLLGRRTRNLLLAVAGVVLVAVLITLVMLKIQKNKDEMIASVLCETGSQAEEIRGKLAGLDTGNPIEFETVAESIQSTEGYDKSQVCLVVLTRYYLAAWDETNVGKYLSMLKTEHSSAGDFDSSVVGLIDDNYVNQLADQARAFELYRESVKSLPTHHVIVPGEPIL